MRTNTKEVRNQFQSILGFLDKKTKLQLVVLSFMQIVFSFLDLLAIFLVGLITILLVNTGNSQEIGSFSKIFLDVINPPNTSIKESIFRLALLIVTLLIVKTALSILLTRKSFSLLSVAAVKKSTEILRRLLSIPHSSIKRQDKQSIIFSITEGTRSVFVEVIGSGLILFADIVLLVMLFGGLAYVDLALSITSLLFFSLVGTILFATLHRKARVYGDLNSKLSVASRKSLMQVLEGQKHIYASGRTDLFVEEFGSLRAKFARVDAIRSFIPYIGKYVIETSIILAGVLMGGLQFLFNDANEALANLAIFFAATTRIAPAVLRVQQSLVQIFGGIGVSSTLLNLVQELETTPSRMKKIIESYPEQEFRGSVVLENVNFRYPDSTEDSLSGVTTQIDQGEFVLIVGRSGSGKTTLIDLILGLLMPSSGDVYISGVKPEEAINRWPKHISYLDQDHYLSDGTVYSNIVPLELQQTTVEIEKLLKAVSLLDLIQSLPEGVGHAIGDEGKLLSGGQRQRIGLARALFDGPKLLFLDEGTSALDWNTEKTIIETINQLHGKVTVIMISHKVSRDFLADKVIYLENGEIEFQGALDTFLSLYPGVVEDGLSNE
jgi:ABC-type multidrug transport system fused ATPase/permease subunit